jgi:adenylate cyclase class 2
VKDAGARPREEIEVKLPATDLSAVRSRLAAAGGTRVAPAHAESNDLYDDAEGALVRSGRTLRLRRANGRALLTFKGPARYENGAKVREEREVEVSDASEAEALLAGLGFSRRFRYEKRREAWDWSGCALALDETPIGDFVEVEGEPTAIRKVVAALGLDFAEAIPYSYAELYRRRRKEDPTLPQDMVFTDPRRDQVQ